MKIKDEHKFTHRDIPVTLYKQPQSSKWWAYWTFNKKSYRKSTGEKEILSARQKTYDLIDSLLQIAPITEIDKAKNIGLTFSQLFQRFISYKSNSNSVSKVAIRDYHTKGRKLLEFFGEWDIELRFRTFGVELYGDYQKWRQTKGRDEYQFITTKNGEKRRGRKLSTKPLSGSTINDECILLHNILNYAYYIERMLKGWIVPPYAKIYRCPTHARLDIPTKEQYQKIKEYFSSRNMPVHTLYVRLVSNCGIRTIEARNLNVSDINFQDGYFMIRNRKQKVKDSDGTTLDTPFPLDSRTKPIIDEILSITQNVRGKEDTLFINHITGKPLGDIKKAWNTMKENIGLSDECSLNCLRTLYITKMCKQSSMPLQILARLIGHKNDFLLQKHYLSLRPEDLRHATELAYLEINHKNDLRKTNNIN